MNQLKDIKYLTKDFSQHREALIEYAKNYFPETYADFNETSPGMMFINMASYVGDVLSYYTDSQLKESLISYAENKSNVINLAQNLGYKIKNKIPAIVDLDVFQLVPAIQTLNGWQPDWDYALTVREGMTVRAANSSIEFRTLDLVNFRVSSSFNPTEKTVYRINNQTSDPEFFLLKKTTKAVAGTVRTETFRFGAAKRYDKILLNNPDIIEVISIEDSDGNKWYEVPYLAQDTIFEAINNTAKNDPETYTDINTPYLLKLRKTARRFITRFRSDSRLEIQFGAGVYDINDEEIIPSPTIVGSNLNVLFEQYDTPIDPSNFMYTRAYGLAPSQTTLTVTYTTGGGIDSNIGSNLLTNITNIAITVDESSLDVELINFVKSSVACNNPTAAVGGRNSESIEEIKQNSMSYFAAQNRIVTLEDLVIRTYAMPSKFGAVAKAYATQDTQLTASRDTIVNPLAINIYTLGLTASNTLTTLNSTVKENLKTYLSSYRMLTDAFNIKDAFIINIGIDFEVITLPDFNSNEVLIRCIDRLKTIFDIKNWQINQPIILSRIYTELDKVLGVQSVPKITIKNLWNLDLGYSGNEYDILSATKNGVIYPSLDPSIFEVKYPNNDIKGKVVTF